MTTFAKPEELVELTPRAIRIAHPDISFPDPITPECVSSLGYLPVEPDEEPILAYGEDIRPGPLRYEDGRIRREWIVIPPPPVESSDVDVERDRRISAGFSFQGVHYQSRLPSPGFSGDWDIFSGKSLEAFIAVMSGAQPGNLRWSDPDNDFTWIAADNTRVPMDAQTVIELGKVAAAHRSTHAFAGSDLKAQSPIPDDYRDDKYWPAGAGE